MSHSHIDWDYNEIAITEDISKGGKACRPRQIAITEAFKRHMHRGEGAFLEGKTNHEFNPYWKVCADLLKLEEYPSNICRHTFASMLLSASQNSVTTAFQMGHTNPVLLYSTYANSVTRRDSEAFWKL
jgi:integrase